MVRLSEGYITSITSSDSMLHSSTRTIEQAVLIMCVACGKHTKAFAIES